MIQTGFESRVKVQQIIESHLPSFILEENPKVSEFLKQYYISQEYQGGPVDIVDNLDQYLKVDNLTSNVVVGFTTLTSAVAIDDSEIEVFSTKGYPQKYGLLKIDDEIITYTNIVGNTFTGCIRGFSGITAYEQDLNREELIFSTSSTAEHSLGSEVKNLSSLFLQEFYKKLKYTISPGLEQTEFTSELNVGNFLKEINSFYRAKGTDESFRVLFNALYNENPKVINLENYLIKPSFAEYVKEEVIIVEKISGENVNNLLGQTIFKSNDPLTNASVSSVEPFSRENKKYYKISLYVGNSEFSAIQGNFVITPNTKSILEASINSSVITVDSTIGFPESGTLIVGNNTFTYTSKTVNQFLGCSGLTENISKNSLIINDETYYGYENNDNTKKVEFRILGVLSDFIPSSEEINTSEGDTLSIKFVGDEVKNSNNKTYKEIFANSWIYNTSTRYGIINDQSNYILSDKIDRSSLKSGDRVELVERDNDIVISGSDDPHISQVLSAENSVIIDGSFPGKNPNSKYDLRRKLNTAKSSGVPIEYGNNVITSDVQNLYFDGEDYSYVASNSLPSESIENPYNYRYTISLDINSDSTGVPVEDNIGDDDYTTIIGFENNCPFLTGDRVFYQPDSTPLVGLNTGSYYVEVLTNKKQIKLYSAPHFIGINPIKFKNPDSGSVGGTFTLYSHKSGEIGVQNILKKIPLQSKIKGPGKETVPGVTGMLINGVEISNYKSYDKVYYGPLESVDILVGGENYDVINLPQISISSGTTNALAQPVISGSIKEVYIDSQNYDIDKILSVEVSGGNGSGASLKPIITKRVREISFDGRTTVNGGGISTTGNRIVLLEDHNLNNGDKILYNSNGNLPIKVGFGSDTLVNNGFYFVKVENNKTVSLYETYEDYESNSNVIGFSTGTAGKHKITTTNLNNTISKIEVASGGSGYTNRKLIVNPSGISTITNSINFKNHGFNTGELIEYDYESSQISGLSTSSQYYVLKIDEDSFRICNAGVGGTDNSFYNRKYYEKFSDGGSGYQYFSYPEISVSIKYSPIGFGTTTQIYKEVVATPIVRGKIEQLYLYDNGTGYGSTILNYQKNPVITVKNGKSAALRPNISNGQIVSVNIQYGGKEYYSLPDLIVTDLSGTGSGAKLRPIIDNGKIVEVIVLSSGIGYSDSQTYITVNSSGKGVKFSPNIRSLTVNNNYKFGDEVLLETDNKLKYTVSSYFEELRTSFGEREGNISGIIGWAYDGNPIYGPFARSNPNNASSTITRVVSGYSLDATYTDRPDGFEEGFFVEDYKFSSSNTTLDEKNGRYGVTQEFPNGVYAYYATIDENGNPAFPYFIGNEYKSQTLEENDTLDQSFDFGNSKLLRNTFPYKISDVYSNYDFISKIDDYKDQKIVLDSVSTGEVERFEVINSGSNYKIEDILNFDNSGTGGSDAYAYVSSLEGKDILNVETEALVYENSIFTWENEENVKVTILPHHSLDDGDVVTISGFSTTLSRLNGSHKIKVTPKSSTLISQIPSSISIGGTEIYLSKIPQNVSVGSSIGIGTETLKVLEVFENKNILRVERGLTGVSHDENSIVNFKSDSFSIDFSTEIFTSKVDDIVFFNPLESVGFGTTAGLSHIVTFNFGDELNVSRQIPTKSIYIENHPFKNNQQVVYTANGTTLSISTDGVSSYSLLSPSNLFIVNKGKNIIGLKTSINSDELFFHSGGTDSDLYSLESVYEQVTGNVERIKSIVSVSTSHEMLTGDVINLTVNPNLSVGIGTSTSVRISKDQNRILVNPIEFNSSGISTTLNVITLNDHHLRTGDKIYYSAVTPATGIATGDYYVFKVDSNTIKLCSTYLDSISIPPQTIDITGTGGASQFISLINPRLKTIKNNNLVFDLSDSSLYGYSFKIYRDSEFKDEFKSTSLERQFNIVEVGTVGTANASITINYDSKLPNLLYYNLENNGVLSIVDKDVKNYSEIFFTNSTYTGTYNIIGVGETTFSVLLKNVPENLSYSSEDCDILKYTTRSKTAKGGIDKIELPSGGYGYKKLPVVQSITSTDGKDSYVLTKSSSIGNIKQQRIKNEKFEYPFDPTLNPTAFVSSNIILSNSNTIDTIKILDGGKGYIQAPDIVIVNSSTREKIDSGILNASLVGDTIRRIEIEDKPKGLPEKTVELFTVNNTNGISIQKVTADSDTTFTCEITKPTFGYDPLPFAVGDLVFLEGIQQLDDGSGFNSEDYGYRFFKVSNYQETSPYDKVVFDLADSYYGPSGLTTNVGTAKTIQEGYPKIISFNDYPTFDVKQSKLSFSIGEQLITNNTERDLFVSSYDGTTLKVSGTYELSVGEVITGKYSSTVATIIQIDVNEGTFNVSYSIPKNVGWIDEIGKLSLDNQVTSNNDYYQNLSYSVKSTKEYKEVEKNIKPLLHTSGLKDFSDTQIEQETNASDLLGIDQSNVIIDYIDDLRVDTIYNFDNVKDIDIDPTTGNSRYIKLETVRLTDYIDNIGNRVLAIDDISNKFSNFEDEPSEFLNVLLLDPSISYENLLVRITNLDGSQIQFTEIVLLNDNDDYYLVEKGNISNVGSSEVHILGENYGEFIIIEDEFNNRYLRFVPENPYDIDYDLKLVRNTFRSSAVGFGTTAVGFVDLVSSAGIITSGETSTVVNLDSNSNSLYANVQVIDNSTNQMNFVELYVTSDGSNTYLSEYYFDTESETSEISNNFIGSFGANISSGGILSLNYTNTSSNNNTFRAKIVGFGTTTLGTGFYRFKTDSQPVGYERSILYRSDFTVGTGNTNIVSIDKGLFNSFKSLVEVSIGSTKSIHQIMLIQDGTDVYVQQSPLLSVSGIGTFDSASGIGTFGGDNSGSDLELNFYPDAEYSSETITLSAFSQCFYTILDRDNDPPLLEYGNIEESIDIQFYNSINGSRINRSNFNLTSDGVPIFAKTFNPTDENILNPSTGEFNIQNHFFKNGEELIYTPKSTVAGIAGTSMVYTDGVTSGTLPSTVFAIVNNLDYDKFQISTSISGTAVTFTNLGGGNAHQFEMKKKNEKAIITLDDLVQSPLTLTNVSHTLSQNISDTDELFVLSGISSIIPSDILKIDDEYFKVTNVGLGTSTSGPITNNGSFNLISTKRGFVGTSATSHTSSTVVDIYRGSYNIVENELHFVDPPRGNPQIERTIYNIDYETSDFNGRVFLRSTYTTNKIYDDLSDQFNGIGRTFTMKVGGADTTGIGTIGGSGIVLINGIFQQPSTDNNPNGNFDILEDTIAGITTLVFSGITKPDTDPLEYVFSDYDINQNETPRGGIIVSYGSTPGLGFAPLVGASVTAVVGAGGSIAGITTGLVGGTYGSGYNGLTSIGVTVYDSNHGGDPASITAVVGAGGSLSFNIGAGGTGYTNPQIFVSSPSYENLSVIGVSRLGIGLTTQTGIGLSISLNVGPVGATGIGSTYYGVTDFEITKKGYSFQRGDVFKPVGLVTDYRLSSPIHDFELLVLETYRDKFASWEFGDLDFIDSIKNYQNGSRTTFPLFYNGDLLSFETKKGSRIKLENCLLIFINGILQKPGFSYNFGGGTSFTFTTAPKPDDNISIYFYEGTGVDVTKVTNINETIKVGDVVQILKSNEYPNILSQDKRTVTDLSFSDKFETNLYSGPGISENYRPLSLIKQKVDKNINGEIVSKARDSIETLVFPVANIISGVSTTDTEIFVDGVELFRYEDPDFSSFDGLIVGGISTSSISTMTGNDSIELVKNFTTIQGESGSIVGIASTTIPNLAIEFTLESLIGTQLQVGYPIYIFDTVVGNGVTSINSSDAETIGIGTNYLDNIYVVDQLNESTGIITCRVHSNSNLVGIATQGSIHTPVGHFSWGRLSNTSGLQRSSNPISIGVTGNIVSGLSTYPIIQRRNVGIRETGALRKRNPTPP